jgi:hypothetical protein
MITTFTVPNSIRTFATAMNPAGQITGYFQDASNITHCFLREGDGTITTFDIAGSPGCSAWPISPSGQIAGNSIDNSIIGGRVCAAG